MNYKTIIEKYDEYQEKDQLNILLSILIKKASKYTNQVKEKEFIINFITKDNKYRSYIESKIYELEYYILECREYSYIDELDEDDIELSIKYSCSRDLDAIIDRFIQTEFPTIKLDSVIDEIGDIFEKVVGEKQGYLRDESGTWNRFGDDNEKYTDLLGLKYPGFYEAVCDKKEKRQQFIEWLDELTEPYMIYEYNEHDLIDGWG